MNMEKRLIFSGHISVLPLIENLMRPQKIPVEGFA